MTILSIAALPKYLANKKMFPTIENHISSKLKPDDMHELKLKQLQYETDTWKRILCFMQEENVHLKNRLSEVLKDRFNNNLLEEVESFQSSFIKEDELISFLRNEVAEIDGELVKEIFVDGKLNKGMDKKIHQLRNNLSNAEKRFGRIKMSFNNYLSENM
jgi:predicted RNase H-like nuclease (RuvC/YqgF family)